MRKLTNGRWYSEEYWTFQIGDELSDKYRLDVSGYSGDEGNLLIYPPHAPRYHNGKAFTAYDRDNDAAPRNCATMRYGGWWFHSCTSVCLACNPPYHLSYVSLRVADELAESRMMLRFTEL